MNKQFSNNRTISIFMLLMLMFFLQCTGFSQDKPGAGKKQQEIKPLSAVQIAQIKTILSGYNPSALTADQAREIHEKFRAAGIHPGPESKDAIIASGFDPEKLRTLAPPPGKDNVDGHKLPSSEERMKMIDEKIIKPLSLNSSQSETVKGAFREFFDGMDKMRQQQENTPAPADKSKIEPLVKARDEKIKKVLGKEQFVKFQDLEREARPPRPPRPGVEEIRKI
jgi:hypothetical protein